MLAGLRSSRSRSGELGRPVPDDSLATSLSTTDCRSGGGCSCGGVAGVASPPRSSAALCMRQAARWGTRVHGAAPGCQRHCWGVLCSGAV